MTLSTKIPTQSITHIQNKIIETSMTGMKYVFQLTFLLATIMIPATTSAKIEPIPLPDTLEGEWVVSTEKHSFKITLTNEKSPKANGYKIATPLPEEAGKLVHAVAWRPYSDGISLTDAQGSTIVFFSRNEDGYRSNISGKTGLSLKRNCK